jgi:hypothetical protein
MNKLKTIKLQGKDYVQVNERVAFFNETYPTGMITAEPTFKDNTVYFKATVIPDVATKDRYFIGHSFGQLGKEKALEKLETVAVGRALAFMGIGIVDSIASADEMQKFQGVKYDKDLEKAGVCDKCGETAIKAKRPNGTLFWTCPEWQNHKAEGERFKIIQPVVLEEHQQKFADSLK